MYCTHGKWETDSEPKGKHGDEVWDVSLGPLQASYGAATS